MPSKLAITKLARKRIQQTILSGDFRHAQHEAEVRRQDLTMDQHALASRLANDFPGWQRTDDDLLDRMRRKYNNSSTSTTLGTITATPQRRAATSSKPRQDINWEVRAAQGIKTKELSLDRQWNELTWKNKSSCYERLKLLKDDGVDITPLQGPKLNSETITRAVLAQVEARKQQRSSHGTAQLTVNDGTATSLLPDPLDNISQATPDALFDHLEYHPRPTQPPKRKQGSTTSTNEVDLFEPHALAEEDEPAIKRRCIMDIRLDSESNVPEEEKPTWELLRSQVLRDIFTTVPEPNPTTAATSHIVINFQSQSSAANAVPGSLMLNSKGYDNIMEDLRVLGDAADEDGNFTIRDPFGPLSVRVITSEPHRTILEGEAAILIALIRRFCTLGKGLLHIAKRYFDENGTRKAFGAAYELGSGTQKELRLVEEELKKAEERGSSMEVQVKWVYVGRTDKWPEKMY